ncbi:E-cinnamoyl-CoA:R-phenyllactate CoA transferase [compost metagenome]
MVAAYMPERWRRLCDVLGLPALADDPRFATSPLRVANRAAMVEALTSVFVTRATDAWLALLQDADILCARVATYEDLMAHPQVAANRMMQRIPHETLGEIRMPGFPINSARENSLPARPAPACGQHTQAALAELGFSAVQIAALQARGAVHCADAVGAPLTATAS